MTAYDALTELALNGPGKAAPGSALTILRRLAHAGDTEAVFGICRVMAGELRHGAPDVMVFHSSLEQVVEAVDMPAVLRTYAAGCLPRLMVVDLSRWAALSAEFPSPEDFQRFQRLVQGGAPISDELLKAFVLGDFARSFGLLGELTGIGPSEAQALLLIDYIMANARIVPGDNADTTFAVGRDLILRADGSGQLMFLLGHEMGHHRQVFMTQSPRSSPAPVGITLTSDLLGEVAAVLVDLLTDAAATFQDPQKLADIRPRVLPSGLSVMCTGEPSPKGPFSHFSFSAGGGPVSLATGIACAWVILQLLDVDLTGTAASYSPHGYFHLAVRGVPAAQPASTRPQDAVDTNSLSDAVQRGEEWFAALQKSGRVGLSTEFPYLLGLDERPARWFGSDPEGACRDLQSCLSLRHGEQPKALALQTLAPLLDAAIRCGNPAAVRGVLGMADRSDAWIGVKPDLQRLGTNCAATRNSAGLTYQGPTVEDLFEIVRILHESGFSVDDPICSDGQTLLTNAACRSAELVHRLLTAGCAVSSCDAKGRTALHQAAAGDDLEIVRLLVHSGANVHAQTADGSTALLDVRSGGTVDTLISAGADPNADNNSGTTALMCAAGRGDAGVVAALVKAGADVDASTDKGFTALHFAAGGSSPEHAVVIVAALINAGAELDAEADDGETPLIVAARQALPEAVAHMLSRGANVAARTAIENTALHFACDGEREWSRDPSRVDRMQQCIGLLIDAGADVNAANSNSETPLLWAVGGYASGPVAMLLEAGADPNAKSRNGWSPLMVARREQRENLTTLLIEAGAHDAEDM